MKKIFSTIMILLTAVLLVACKKEVNEGEIIDLSEGYQRKSTLVVWMDDEKGDYMKELIALFNQTYPNIHVQFKHAGSVDTREQLKVFGPSGQGADVIQFPHDHLAQAFLEDLIYELPQSTRDIVNTRSDALGIEVSTMEVDGVKGLYGVPLSAESVALFYNKDLITEPHTTFEALIEDAKVWNAKEIETSSGVKQTNLAAGRPYLTSSNHFADSYFMQAFYSAFGFRPFGDEGNDPSEVGFAKAAPALEWFRTQLQPITTGPNGKNNENKPAAFEAGQIPYIIAGPWNIEAYKEAGINLGVIPFPTIKVDGEDKVTRTFAGAQVAAVYKYTKNPTDAIKWVEFLSTTEAMEIMFKHKSKLPALKSELIAEIPGLADDEALLGILKQLETSIPMPYISNITYYWGPGETMITNLWNDPSTVIANLVETAEEAYKDLASI